MTKTEDTVFYQFLILPFCFQRLGQNWTSFQFFAWTVYLPFVYRFCSMIRPVDTSVKQTQVSIQFLYVVLHVFLIRSIWKLPPSCSFPGLLPVFVAACGFRPVCLPFVYRCSGNCLQKNNNDETGLYHTKSVDFRNIYCSVVGTIYSCQFNSIESIRM